MLVPNPEPRVIQSINRFKNALLLSERAASMRLVNTYGAIYLRLQEKIRAIEADIAELGDNPSVNQVERLRRFRELQAQTVEEMDRFAAVLEHEVNTLRVTAIDDATNQVKTLVQQSLPNLPYPVQARIMAIAHYQWGATVLFSHKFGNPA